MYRLARGALIAVFVANFLLIGQGAAPVFAAITCTAGSPGYSSTAKNVFYDPPQRPTWENNGHLDQTSCTDGLGISVQWKGWDKNYDTEGRPVAMSSVNLHTDSGDDCSTWDQYTVTNSNVSINSHTTAWHWQPVVVCGVAPAFNTHNHASGTMTLTGVYVWSWSINWP